MTKLKLCKFLSRRDRILMAIIRQCVYEVFSGETREFQPLDIGIRTLQVR